MHVERPNQTFDWSHSTFENSDSDIQKAFDFGNPVTISDGVEHSMIDNVHYTSLFSPRVRHTPYTIPRRHRPSPHKATQQGEGTSRGMAPCDLSPGFVLNAPPPAPAAPSPAPAPVPSLVPSPVPSPAPSTAPVPAQTTSSVPAQTTSLVPAQTTSLVPAQTTSSVFFGLGDLNKSKVKALFQLKCEIFDSSFLPNDDVIKQMAIKCLNDAVCHSDELLAWSKTADGSNEITRMCSALVTIRKNIQALTRSAVLWGYNLHQLLHTEKEVVKFFIGDLLDDETFLRGVINVNGKDVNIPFGSRAMRHYIRQLLYHDRQYKHFIENKRNIQPLYTYTSVLFKWALTEMSSGVFRELDFKIAEAIKDHDTMVKLFKTLTREQLDALTANILD